MKPASTMVSLFSPGSALISRVAISRRRSTVGWRKGFGRAASSSESRIHVAVSWPVGVVATPVKATPTRAFRHRKKASLLYSSLTGCGTSRELPSGSVINCFSLVRRSASTMAWSLFASTIIRVTKTTGYSVESSSEFTAPCRRTR
jgi:hypothetical protein